MKSVGLSMCLLHRQPDERLIELAQAGNERAFEALVERHRRALISYSRRLSSSDAGAEDAVQQALLHAWLALRKPGIEVRDAGAWLHRIVHNVAVSNFRRSNLVLPETESADGATGADSEFERRLAATEALAGLAALPELQRQVMLSTALEGRSHAEIAESFGLTQGAVRGLIYRARATLRAGVAAWVPAPLVNWIAGQPSAGGGPATGLYEALAGGGSIGFAGALLKSGAVVLSIGAMAAATGLPAGDPGVGSAHVSRSSATTSTTSSTSTRVRGRAAASALPVPSLPVAVPRVGQPPPRIGGQSGEADRGRRGGQHSGSRTVSAGGSGRGPSGGSGRGPSGASGRQSSDSSGGSGSGGSGSGGSGSSGPGSSGRESTGGSRLGGRSGSSDDVQTSIGPSSGSGSSASESSGSGPSGSGPSRSGPSGNGSSPEGSSGQISTSGSGGTGGHRGG